MKPRIGFVPPGREPERVVVYSRFQGEVGGTYIDSGEWED